jgi:hypothetical protein
MGSSSSKSTSGKSHAAPLKYHGHLNTGLGPAVHPGSSKKTTTGSGSDVCGADVVGSGGGVVSQTSYVDFTTTTALDDLPSNFKAAVTRSSMGTNTVDDDALIGSAGSGCGYCSQADYAQQTYCACVNSAAANPECVVASCANEAYAYKTIDMHKVLDNASRLCPNEVTCIQVMAMGGSKNVASGITQEQNCDGTSTTGSKTRSWEVLFVMIVLVIILILLGYLVARVVKAKKSNSTTTGSGVALVT